MIERKIKGVKGEEEELCHFTAEYQALNVHFHC